MQKYIHLVQIVETEKVAANQLRTQLEDQDTEIERLKSEVHHACAHIPTSTISHPTFTPFMADTCFCVNYYFLSVIQETKRDAWDDPNPLLTPLLSVLLKNPLRPQFGWLELLFHCCISRTL